VIKRISHVLWCDMIFIQLIVCFLSLRQGSGIETHKVISHHKPWEILYVSFIKRMQIYFIFKRTEFYKIFVFIDYYRGIVQRTCSVTPPGEILHFLLTLIVVHRNLVIISLFIALHVKCLYLNDEWLLLLRHWNPIYTNNFIEIPLNIIEMTLVVLWNRCHIM
jgi:hypothetical protein